MATDYVTMELGKLRRLTAGLSGDVYIALTERGVLLVDNPETEAVENLFTNDPEDNDPWGDEYADISPAIEEPQIVIPAKISELATSHRKDITPSMIKQFLDIYIRNNCKMEGPCCRNSLNNALFRMTGHDGKTTDALLYDIIEANKLYIEYVTSGN